jgi:hypothetical protein
MSGSTTITILGRMLAVMAASRAARALGICLGDAAWRRDSILLASRPGDPPSLVFRRVPRALYGTQIFTGASLGLTELSNVVAYVCRLLQRKIRHHVHSTLFPSSRVEPLPSTALGAGSARRRRETFSRR